MKNDYESEAEQKERRDKTIAEFKTKGYSHDEAVDKIFKLEFYVKMSTLSTATVSIANSSKRLEYLTIGLVILTIVLGFLTFMLLIRG